MVILPDADSGCADQGRVAASEGSAPIGVSVGIASIPETSTSVIDLVAMADAALSEAKRSGKNRIVTTEKRGAAGRDDGPRLAALG